MNNNVFSFRGVWVMKGENKSKVTFGEMVTWMGNTGEAQTAE